MIAVLKMQSRSKVHVGYVYMCTYFQDVVFFGFLLIAFMYKYSNIDSNRGKLLSSWRDDGHGSAPHLHQAQQTAHNKTWTTQFYYVIKKYVSVPSENC